MSEPQEAATNLFSASDVSDRHLYEAAQIAQAQEREALAQLRASDAERQRAEADERRRAQGEELNRARLRIRC